MANLNANFENFVAHVGKHGFDVGKDNFFTAAPGMILPVWKDILNAGERLHIRISDIVRTNPMMKPASLHIRQKVDVFFVPASMIYTAFGQNLFQTNDLITSLFAYSDESSGNYQFMNSAGYLPSSRMESYTTLSGFNSLSLGKFFESNGKSRFRLAMMLGYNPFALIHDVSYVDENDDTYYVSPFNNNPSIFPWAAATYQAIYHNWYRNDDWEERSIREYNLDWLLYGSDISLNYFLTLHYHQRVGDYFSSIKRSPVMSTVNLTNPGYGDDEDSSMVLSKVNSYLASDFDSPYPTSINGQSSEAASDKGFGSVATGETLFTPSSIRTLFAVEKYLRITGRAAKNYDSQVLAHFGYNVPRDIKHEISYLGGFDGYLDSKQIISTAGTASTELGEQAGYGEGQLGGDAIKFTAPCHGFVMAVFYVVPEFSYPQGMIFDKLNAISTRLDFFFPEYDKLGKQPMFAYECFPIADPTDTRDYKNIDVSNYIGSSNRNQIVGWQYRYEHFKRQYNVHSLAFYRPYTDYSTDNDWASWIIGKNPFDIYQVAGSSVDIDYRSLLVTPFDLDRIFVQQYKNTCDISDLESPWLIFQTDPIMVALKVDAKKTSAMSPTGEPDLF